MDLNTILKKTENKKAHIKKINPNKVQIANKDRPYDFKEIKKNSSIKKQLSDNNKLTTNGQQTDYESNDKLTTNEQQTDYESNDKLTTNGQQTDYNNRSKIKLLSINKITGLQKKVLAFIFFECKKTGSQITKELSVKEIMDELSTTKKNVKTSIYRLEKKNVITREDFKNGRGGWTKYKISEEIYSELHIYQTISNQDTKLNENKSKLTTNTLSSSSNINTTTYLYENINLENIKKALKLSHIPNGQFFDKGSLKAIFNENGGELTPEQIQFSIDSFAYGLEHHFNEAPYSTMKEPGAVLFKKLKQGEIWDEPRYLTPSELEIKKYYDNLCVAFAKNEKQHFDLWLNANRDEIFKKCQARLPSIYHLSESEFMEKAAKEFKENILPELKIQHALDILGHDKKELIQKIEGLKLT